MKGGPLNRSGARFSLSRQEPASELIQSFPSKNQQASRFHLRICHGHVLWRQASTPYQDLWR
jgi:hypothetical protein